LALAGGVVDLLRADMQQLQAESQTALEAIRQDMKEELLVPLDDVAVIKRSVEDAQK
jgi:hypothetical protein